MRPSASILGAALACCSFFLVSAQEDSTFTSIASGIVRPSEVSQSASSTAGATPSACTPTAENPIFSQEKLYELTTNFWTNFMYPNNCAQAQAINSDLLAENVQGRIDLTRTFVGAELNTEYLFGLFCNLQSGTSFNVLGSPVNFTYTQFVGQGNLVANTVLIYFNLSSVGLISPVSIQSYINFDSCGRISQYDAVFKWMDWQFQTVFAAAAALLGTTNLTLVQEEVAGLLATNICGVADSYCTGSLQQYNSTEECMGFLTQQVPFGEAWQLGMNTLVCRDMHVNMVPFRPDVHCAHIGPTGGGYCSNDRTYATSVEDVFFNDEEAMLQIPS